MMSESWITWGNLYDEFLLYDCTDLKAIVHKSVNLNGLV